MTGAIIYKHASCAVWAMERSVRFDLVAWEGKCPLDISDAGSQPTPQIGLSLPAWRPGGRLTPLEDQMVASAADGELVDCGKGPFDLAEMQAWGRERAARAEVLRHLLVGDKWPVAAKGVRLRGVRISGHLDLEAATVRCPLRLESCYLDDDQPLALGFATVSVFELKGCHLAGLAGNSLVVSKNLDLRGSTFTHPVDLSAAGITGRLICTGTQLTGKDENGIALTAFGMKVGGCACFDGRFTAAGTVLLQDADIGDALTLSDAQLNGKDKDASALAADWIKVCGAANLTKMVSSAGAIRLVGADIAGDLTLSGAQLNGTDGKEEGSNALFADSIKVGGRVSLDEGFTAAGAVRMAGADITGRLRFRGAVLNGKDNHGCALLADGMKVGGGVGLDKTSTTNGALRLAGADIAGDLRLSNAQLNGTDHDCNALAANEIKVSNNVVFDSSSRSPSADGSTAQGALSLKSAHVGGSFYLRPEKLAAGKDDDGKPKVALNMEGARIAHDLVWHPGQPIEGQVILEDAQVGLLTDNLANHPNGGWPPVRPDQLLRLNGFTYRGFGGDHQGEVWERLRWIGSPDKANPVREWIGRRKAKPVKDSPAAARFASQPYEQLAAVYRQIGQDTEARKVAIAKRANLRRYGDLKWHRRAGNWLLHKTIKYGYQTWRAGIALAVVFVAFWLLAILAQHHHLIEPVGSFHGPPPTATQCTDNYPCFYPLGYTVDTVIPIINVHQAAYWAPNTDLRWGWAWDLATWIATGLGWALATLLIAGYTGLVRQD